MELSGEATTRPSTSSQPYLGDIVDFDGQHDPYQPINWPLSKKLIHTALYGITTMSTPWASAIYSPAVDVIVDRFHVGKEVAILGLSLCLLE